MNIYHNYYLLLVSIKKDEMISSHSWHHWGSQLPPKILGPPLNLAPPPNLIFCSGPPPPNYFGLKFLGPPPKIGGEGGGAATMK